MSRLPASIGTSASGQSSLAAPSSKSLEPANWSDFKQLGYAMVDDMADYLAGLSDRPVWQPVPDQVQDQLREPLPLRGQEVREVYQDFKRTVLPFPRGNIHPRFWGWVNGSGVPLAAYADFLASTMNGTVSSSESAAMFVEEQVLRWLMTMFDWPAEGDGLLTSGCSMGQILAVAAARVKATNGSIREGGARGGPDFTVYCSTETHLSVQKAVELLGIGRANLRKIPVDDQFRIRTDQLIKAIAADRATGHTPLCIVGNVGTVNTGAIDPIGELISIARAEKVWMHIDGAFGAFAYLLPTHRALLASMKEADSLIFDLHKWFYMPFDVSCILMRDPSALRAAFSLESPYTSKTSSGPASSHISFADRGIEQTRSFRALKVWFTLKAFGLETFAASIAENLDQIRHLNALLAGSADLELVAYGGLNVTCFRYVDDGKTQEELNDLNRAVLAELQTTGIAVPSHTIIDGKFVIRVANNNHRTRHSDIELLVKSVRSIGQKLIGATG